MRANSGNLHQHYRLLNIDLFNSAERIRSYYLELVTRQIRTNEANELISILIEKVSSTSSRTIAREILKIVHLLFTKCEADLSLFKLLINTKSYPRDTIFIFSYCTRVCYQVHRRKEPIERGISQIIEQHTEILLKCIFSSDEQAEFDGFTIKRKHCPTILLNYLYSQEVKKDLLIQLYQAIFQQLIVTIKDIKPYQIDLIQLMLENDLIEKIQEQHYFNRAIMFELPIDYVYTILDAISEKTFRENFMLIKDVSYRFYNQKLNLQILNKVCKYKIAETTYISKIIEQTNLTMITPEVWDYLASINCIVDDAIISQIISFVDPIIIASCAYDPHRFLNTEQIDEVLKCDNIAVLGEIMIPTLRNDILSTPEFWIKYGKLYTQQYFNNDAVYLFFNRILNTNLTIDSIILASNPPDVGFCHFFMSATQLYYGIVELHITQKFIDFFDNLHSPLFYEFWMCFSDVKELIQIIPNISIDSLPYFWYGLSIIAFWAQCQFKSDIKFIMNDYSQNSRKEMLNYLEKKDVLPNYADVLTLQTNLMPETYQYFTFCQLILDSKMDPSTVQVNDCEPIDFYIYISIIITLLSTIPRHDNNKYIDLSNPFQQYNDIVFQWLKKATNAISADISPDLQRAIHIAFESFMNFAFTLCSSEPIVRIIAKTMSKLWKANLINKENSFYLPFRAILVSFGLSGTKSPSSVALTKLSTKIGPYIVTILYEQYIISSYQIKSSNYDFQVLTDGCQQLLTNPTPTVFSFLQAFDFNPFTFMNSISVSSLMELFIHLLNSNPFREISSIISLVLRTTKKWDIIGTIPTDILLKISQQCTIDFIPTLHLFASLVISDDATLYRLYVQMLSQFSSDMRIDLSSFLPYMEESKPEILGKAINTIFERTASQPTNFYRKVNIEPLPHASKNSMDFAQALLDLALRELQPPVLMFLASIALTHSFLFSEMNGGMNIEEIITILVNNIKNTDHVCDQEVDDVTKRSCSIITVLFVFSFIPQFADVFIPYIFTSDLDDDQTLGLYLILGKLMTNHSCQPLIFGLMIKYKWMTKAIGHMNKCKSPLLIDTILSLLSGFIKFLSAPQPGCLESASSISELDKPFTTLIDFPMYLEFKDKESPIMMLKHTTGPTAWEPSLLCDLLKKRPFITSNHEPIPAVMEVLDHPKNISLDSLPACFDHQCFMQLPESLLPTVIHNNVPVLTKPLSTKMFRYLSTQPSWITQWILTHPFKTLLPQHYSILYQTIEKLNELANEPLEKSDWECYMYTYYDFPEFYESLLNLTSVDFFNTIKHQLSTLIINLQHTDEMKKSINDFLSGTLSHIRFIRILSILKAAKADDYNEKILSLACSAKYRDFTDVMNSVLHLFNQLEIGDYDQLLCFILMNNNSALLERTLKLCSGNQALFKNSLAFPFFESCFNRLLALDQSLDVTEKMLHYFPAHFLEKFSDQINNRISSIFNNFSSEKIKELQILFSVAPIPPIEQSFLCDSRYHELPPFWQLIYENRERMAAILSLSPTLISGSFSFMKQASVLLDFAMRVKCFRENMKKKRSESEVTLIIRRDQILNDSFSQLNHFSQNFMLGKISIKFFEESGVDLGGLLKDWYTSLIQELFNPNYALFTQSISGRTFWPNPSSSVNRRHLEYFEFAGKIFARAIFDEIYLAAHLSKPFLKQIIGIPVSLSDLEDIDNNLYSSLMWMLNNSIESLPEPMTFTVDVDDLGQHKLLELVPNGQNIPVNDSNKNEFVSLMVNHRLTWQIKFQLEAFCKGFYQVIGRQELLIFSPEEFDLVCCGSSRINISDWEEHCEYAGQYHRNHPIINMFFRVISKWSSENISKLLLFITGSPQIPLNGFAEFNESGRPIIIASGSEKNRLVAAHTCTNTLDLPPYENDQEMNDKLLFAIRECNSFGII